MDRKWVKKTISMVLAASLLSGCASQSAAPQQETSNEEIPVGSVWQPREDTERTQRARETYEELFGDLELAINEQNPDFTDIMNNFIYGDTYHQSDLLTTEEKELIALVSLTTQQSYELLKQRSVAAVNVGLTPEEVMEAVVHCSPYVGMATTYDAVSAVAEAFTANGIELPLQSQTMVSDDGRYDGGAAVQHELFGMNPQPGSSDITDYVTAWCFGDFYTRGSIPVETREMLTMCILANMGVSQFSAHVMGTYQAGHSKEKILAAMAQMMPYMGTPRTLTAVGIIHEVLPEDNTEESNADDSGSTDADIEADAPGNLLSENFTGRAWAKMMDIDETWHAPMTGLVTFEAGARNYWHSHDGAQILIVTSGAGYCQFEGEAAFRMEVGDMVIVPPGVTHWHGAGPDGEFAHLSLSVPAPEGYEDEQGGWYEAVTDDEYTRAVEGAVPVSS